MAEHTISYGGLAPATVNLGQPYTFMHGTTIVLLSVGERAAKFAIFTKRVSFAPNKQTDTRRAVLEHEQDHRLDDRRALKLKSRDLARKLHTDPDLDETHRAALVTEWSQFGTLIAHHYNRINELGALLDRVPVGVPVCANFGALISTPFDQLIHFSLGELSMTLMFHDPDPKPIALESVVLDIDIIEGELCAQGFDTLTDRALFEAIRVSDSWKPVECPELWGDDAPEFEIPEIPLPTANGPCVALTTSSRAKRVREEHDEINCKRHHH
jgi:hypothetical protein